MKTGLKKAVLCLLISCFLVQLTGCDMFATQQETTTTTTEEETTTMEEKNVIKEKNTTDAVVYNRVGSCTLETLGVQEGDMDGEDNIRFTVNGEEIPVYYDEGVYYYQIAEIPANSTVTVSYEVGGVNRTAFVDVATMFDSTAGSKSIYNYGGTPYALAADGSLIYMSLTSFSGSENIEITVQPESESKRLSTITYGTQTVTATNKSICIKRSTDGGKTWTSATPAVVNGKNSFYTYSSSYVPVYTSGANCGQIAPSSYTSSTAAGFSTWVNRDKVSKSVESAGFVTDTATGTMFYALFEYSAYTCMQLDAENNYTVKKIWNESKQYYASQSSSKLSSYDATIHIYRSDDNGATWTEVEIDETNKPKYTLFYANGLVCKSYDGATGDGVDYLFAVAGSDNEAQNFYNSSLYSTDGGDHWQYSTSKISLSTTASFEGGNSEPTIAYLPNSDTIVMYMRNQSSTEYHFGVSFSYDHGKTWTTGSDMTRSEVYATNTQPLLVTLSDGRNLLIWGGNNAMGGASYKRFPLNIAELGDDGITVVKILDLCFDTDDVLQNYNNKGFGNAGNMFINPMAVVFTEADGTESLFVAGGGMIAKTIVVHDIKSYIDKTTGGYDSFEKGTEGWTCMEGTAEVVATDYATAGSKAYHLLATSTATLASRSVPSMNKGTISFDATVVKAGTGINVELQTAFHTSVGAIATPISFDLSTMVTVGKTAHVEVTFDSEKGTATVLVDGTETKTIDYSSKEGYRDICFINLILNSSAECYIDNLVIWDAGN